MDHPAQNPVEEVVISKVDHDQIIDMREEGLTESKIFTFQTSPTKRRNHKHDVRVVTIGNDPWFVAKDVYAAIGLKQWGGILNPLNDDEKVTLQGRNQGG